MRSLGSWRAIKASLAVHLLTKCLTLLGLLLFVFTSLPSPVEASNSHDHLQSLPFAENFESVIPDIFNLNGPSQRLTQLFPQNNTFEVLLATTFNVSPAWINSFVAGGGFNDTLLDLCQKLS